MCSQNEAEHKSLLAKDGANGLSTGVNSRSAKELSRRERRKAKEEKRSRAANRHKESMSKIPSHADPESFASSWEKSVIAL